MARWAVQLGGSYQPYDEEVSQRIEAAYVAKLKETRSIDIRGKNYIVAFQPADHMRQILESDRSRQRPVVRTAAPASASAAPMSASAAPASATAAAASVGPPPAAPTPAATKRKRKLPDFSAAAVSLNSPLTEAEAKKDATATPTPVPAPAPAAKRVSKPKADEYVAADEHVVRLTPESISAALKHLAQFEELSELALAADAETLFERESVLQTFERMCDARMRQGKSTADGDMIVRDLKRKAGGVWSPESVLTHEAAIRGHTTCDARLQRIGTCVDLARLLTADPPLDFGAMCDTEVLRSPLHAIHGIGEHTMRRFLLFALGRSDVLLADPAGALNAWLEHRFGIPAEQTTAAVERRRLDATRPRAKKFVSSSTLSAAADDVARVGVPDTIRVEPLHLVPGTEGGRGRVSFPTALTTLLHAETRMVLRGAAARLAASGEVDASAELGELAERRLTSACGAFLYERGACLRLHLDDVAACNANPYDPRVALWNFGNDCHFKWVPATTTARAMWKTRTFDCTGPERTATLRHGDALLINVERIAHGVKVLTTGADDDATRLLGDRRICVPIRPVADAAYARQHAAFRDGR